MTSSETGPAPPLAADGSDAQPDVETLRLAYANVMAQMDLQREDYRKVATELAGLPPLAGGIITVFFAFRPDNLPTVFPYLYGLALVPFCSLSA